MGKPPVSIFWLNYNSESFIDIVLESVESIKNLNYPNFELIVVDNGSTDKSFKILKNFLEKSSLNFKIIKLKKNIGFTGGNNVAYKARNRNTKYILLLNNDAYLYPDSLENLVEYMENDERIGGASGIILQWDERRIDTAGDFLDECLFSHLFLRGERIRKIYPIYTTYADGACSIYRVEAIKKTGKELFDKDMFAYFDDVPLGLRMWNGGFTIVSFPLVLGKHKRSSSFSKIKLQQNYFGLRGYLTLNEICNSRFKHFIRLTYLRDVLAQFVKNQNVSLTGIKVFLESWRIGKKKEEKLNLYKAPVIRLDLKIIYKRLFSLKWFWREIQKKLKEKIKNFYYS